VSAASVEGAVKVERLEEMVEKDVNLTFFVAGDVFAKPVNELVELFGIRHGKCIMRRGEGVKDLGSALIHLPV
jgi:hypothetical protein